MTTTNTAPENGTYDIAAGHAAAVATYAARVAHLADIAESDAAEVATRAAGFAADDNSCWARAMRADAMFAARDAAKARAHAVEAARRAAEY